MSQDILNYLRTNYLEILGMLLTFCYLFFSVRGKVWLWVFGFLSALCYLVVFYQSRFYAVGTLQIYYIVVSVYGFYKWTKNTSDDGSDGKIRNITKKQFLTSVIFVLICWVILWFVLSRYTDSPVPLGDAFNTSMAIVATWLLVNKTLENWLFFIISDVVCIGLFIYQALYPTTILYVVYVVIGVVGYWNWRRKMRAENALSE